MITAAPTSDYLLVGCSWVHSAALGAYGTSGGSTMSAATSIRDRRSVMVPFATGTVATRRLHFGASAFPSAHDTFRGCIFFAPPSAAGFSSNVASRFPLAFSPGCVFLGDFVSRLLRQ